MSYSVFDDPDLFATEKTYLLSFRALSSFFMLAALALLFIILTILAAAWAYLWALLPIAGMLLYGFFLLFLIPTIVVVPGQIQIRGPFRTFYLPEDSLIGLARGPGLALKVKNRRPLQVWGFSIVEKRTIIGRSRWRLTVKNARLDDCMQAALGHKAINYAELHENNLQAKRTVRVHWSTVVVTPIVFGLGSILSALAISAIGGG